MTGRGTNAYLLPGGNPTLIDAPEASDAFVDRVAEALDTEQPGTPLSQVLITHFHHDHIDGVEALARRWPHLTIAKMGTEELAWKAFEVARKRWTRYSASRHILLEELIFVREDRQNQWVDLAPVQLGSRLVSRQVPKV